MSKQAKAKDKGKKPTPKEEAGSDLIDIRLAKALSDRLRVRIMVEMAKSPLSPNEFSILTGVSLTDCAYHFRALDKYECIELIDTAQRRGATEHFYRLTKRALINDEEFARFREMPGPIRTGFNGSILATFIDQFVDAMEADTMDEDENRHVTWRTLKLDRGGFDRVMGKLMEAYDLAGAEHLAARDRIKESGEEPVYATLGMFGFRSPAPERAHNLEDSPVDGEGCFGDENGTTP